MRLLFFQNKYKEKYTTGLKGHCGGAVIDTKTMHALKAGKLASDVSVQTLPFFRFNLHLAQIKFSTRLVHLQSSFCTSSRPGIVYRVRTVLENLEKSLHFENEFPGPGKELEF